MNKYEDCKHARVGIVHNGDYWTARKICSFHQFTDHIKEQEEDGTFASVIMTDESVCAICGGFEMVDNQPIQL